MHRVIGTGIGLLLTWGLLMLPLGNWGASLMMMALAFIIETLIVRHYGLAAVFFTPMAIFLAELATFGQSSPAVLIEARFFDTVLGCAVGFGGGFCLHNPRFRGDPGAADPAVDAITTGRLRWPVEHRERPNNSCDYDWRLRVGNRCARKFHGKAASGQWTKPLRGNGGEIVGLE